ncbi:MAG: HupE/UreJ family protein [Acidobacteria bacterium]|nr:HupE/UreJ family protein [Acidobacteriota bacterium]
MPSSCVRRAAGWTLRVAAGIVAGSVILEQMGFAHGVAGKDAAFLQDSAGADLVPFGYLGAKHIVTGYDHLLFLFGIIFFLYRLSDVAV